MHPLYTELACHTASCAAIDAMFTCPPSGPLFLLFENSKAIADFDTKAVSKIDQTWRILARRRSVKSRFDDTECEEFDPAFRAVKSLS